MYQWSDNVSLEVALRMPRKICVAVSGVAVVGGTTNCWSASGLTIIWWLVIIGPLFWSSSWYRFVDFCGLYRYPQSNSACCSFESSVSSGMSNSRSFRLSKSLILFEFRNEEQRCLKGVATHVISLVNLIQHSFSINMVFRIVLVRQWMVCADFSHFMFFRLQNLHVTFWS